LIDEGLASGVCEAGSEENDFRFHDLRHTFASHLVMRGVGLRAVQEVLIHCDLKLTMRYAHLAPGHLRDSVNALNDLGGKKTRGGEIFCCAKVDQALIFEKQERLAWGIFCRRSKIF
jgi:hypothetical protein